MGYGVLVPVGKLGHFFSGKAPCLHKNERCELEPENKKKHIFCENWNQFESC